MKKSEKMNENDEKTTRMKKFVVNAINMFSTIQRLEGQRLFSLI